MRAQHWDDDWTVRAGKRARAREKFLPQPVVRKKTMAALPNFWTDQTTDGTACSFDLSTSATNFLIINNSTATITTTNMPTGSSNSVYAHSGGQWVVADTIKVPKAQVMTPKAQALRDPRILNRYLNSADLLEEFIRDLGQLGARQQDVLAVPIEMFVNWLVCKAAEEDDADVGDIKALPSNVQRTDRCRCCGRYIHQVRRDSSIYFCSGAHQEVWLNRNGVEPANIRDVHRIEGVLCAGGGDTDEADGHVHGAERVHHTDDRVRGTDAVQVPDRPMRQVA